MIIQLDEKKISRQRRCAQLALLLCVLFILLLLWSGISGRGALNTWTYLLMAFVMFSPMAYRNWRTINHADTMRHVEHHLFLDDTRLTIVNGYERIDLLWDEVQNIAFCDLESYYDTLKLGWLKNWTGTRMYVTIRLPPDMPDHRCIDYTLYDNYDRPLHDIYLDLRERWEQSEIDKKAAVPHIITPD